MTTDERLEKVERQLARVRFVNRCVIGCIVLSLAVWGLTEAFGPETAWAQAGVKAIRANKFVLEDENGKVRAILGMAKDRPGLALCNANGNVRAVLESGKEGPMLALCDENGEVRAAFDVDKDGPSLSLYDANDKVRSVLGSMQTTTADGKHNIYPVSSLILFGPDGKVIWSAPIGRKGE